MIRTVWICGGDVGKYGFVHAKVLGKDPLRGVRYPVVDHECCSRCVEVSVIEGEEIFILVAETLQSVGFAFREIPDITRLELFDLIFPVLVDCRQQKLASVHVSPFSHAVPVELTI